MYMEDLVPEFIEGLDRIHHLPYKMRRIIVDPQMIAVEDPEHTSPDHRRRHQILAARPLILTKEHRAVFNGDLHTVRLCKTDQRLPYLFHQLKILFHRFRLIPSDKRSNHIDAKLCTCKDHILKMRRRFRPLLQIFIHRVRIVSKGRDLHVIFICVILDVRRIIVV